MNSCRYEVKKKKSFRNGNNFPQLLVRIAFHLNAPCQSTKYIVISKEYKYICKCYNILMQTFNNLQFLQQSIFIRIYILDCFADFLFLYKFFSRICSLIIPYLCENYNIYLRSRRCNTIANIILYPSSILFFILLHPLLTFQNNEVSLTEAEIKEFVLIASDIFLHVLGFPKTCITDTCIWSTWKIILTNFIWIKNTVIYYKLKLFFECYW